jgi:hypothetical protein
LSCGYRVGRAPAFQRRIVAEAKRWDDDADEPWAV